MATITRRIIKLETYQVRGTREEAAIIVDQLEDGLITFGDLQLTLIDTSYEDERITVDKE